MWSDLMQHRRFLVSALIGLAAGLLAVPLAPTDRILLGADLFYGVFLISTALLLPKIGPKELRSRSDDSDEGMPIIILIALIAIGLSLMGIIQTMRGAGHESVLRTVLAMMSIPLGWAMLHCVMAFHYAGMWYALNGDRRDARGLDFGPDQPDPVLWDFLYYSFTIGMAAQTSDVALRSPDFRRVTLMHAVLSYFFNTVIIALAVGAASSLVR